MSLQEIKNLCFLYSSSSTCSGSVPHFERCHSSSTFAKDQACFDLIFFFNNKRPSIKEPDNVTMSLKAVNEIQSNFSSSFKKVL